MGSPLETADAVRAADPERALRLYVEARDGIDPCDADRVGWLAEHGERAAELIPLFRETVQRSGGALRWSAAYTLGHLVDLLEEPAEAAPHLALVVREAHDIMPVRWLRACVNLAQCHRLLGRPLECLVLARRAERRAAALGEGRIRAIACLHLTGVLSDLRDGPRMAEALGTFREALDAPGAEVDPLLPVLFLGYRSQLLSLQDDVEGALEDLDGFVAGLPEGPQAAAYVAEAEAARAELHLRAGRHGPAERHLAAAVRADLDRPDFRLLLGKTRLAVTLATAGRGAARPLAHALLEELWSFWPRVGAGTVLRYAADLGRVLLDEFDDLEDARHAFDLAARAMLTRVVELERCARELPELGEPSPEDEAVLADYRERFEAEHGELLDLVAGYLKDRAVAASDLVVADGLVAVCAWCKRVRVRDGRWLPLGAYLPGEDRIDVTAGICRPCRRGLRA